LITIDRKEQKLRHEEINTRRDGESNFTQSNIFAKSDQDEKKGMLKLPDELKELVSGEQVYRKRTHRQKM